MTKTLRLAAALLAGLALPVLGKIEKPLPLPESISNPVLTRRPPPGGGGGPLPQGAAAKPVENA